MKIRVLADADSVAEAAAEFIAAKARAAVRAQGRFVMALSGGHTPRQMLRSLALQEVPWDGLHVVQVDERIAPWGHPDRNLTQLRESLVEHSPLREDQILAMRVESPDLEVAADEFAKRLSGIAGSPPVLDLVQLGIGLDGHTASLVPGDPALDVTESTVALTGVYQGRLRMTMTYPILNRSRHILWIVIGVAKAGMLLRLRAGDMSIPAGRVNRKRALILADCAAGQSDPSEVGEELP